MDKHSPKICIKVNGTETTYAEREKKPAVSAGEAAMLPSVELPSNIVPLRMEYEEAMINKRTVSAGKRIAITIGSAILLGTGFGVTVLHMLNGDEQSSKAAPVAVTAEKAPSDQQKKETSKASMALQSIQVYVMQEAMVSTKEKGQALVEDLKKKGIPASIRVSEGKFYLLTAVANDEQTAKAIGRSYNDKGINEYFKTWRIDQKEVPKTYEKQAALLIKTEGLLVALLRQSSLYYSSGKADDKEWSRIKKDMQALIKEGKSADKEDLKKLLTYTSLAYNTLENYKTKKDKETFTKLQQLLLDGLTSYESMVTGVKGP
jgi:stage II sporulation protein B